MNKKLTDEILLTGDLSRLTKEEKLTYYHELCGQLGLNPNTRPFMFLRLGGKLTLYATRDCADQLRRVHGISTEIVSARIENGVYVVHVRASMPDGRNEDELGATSVDGLQGAALANAVMTAATKAKRRATLSICGLGMLDETEISSIPDASPEPFPAESAPKPTPAPEPKPEPAPKMSRRDQMIAKIMGMAKTLELTIEPGALERMSESDLLTLGKELKQELATHG